MDINALTVIFPYGENYEGKTPYTVMETMLLKAIFYGLQTRVIITPSRAKAPALACNNCLKLLLQLQLKYAD
jgi:hypothetical protein